MSTKHERRTIYATKRWGLLRLEALARDGGLCARCRAEGRTVLAEIVQPPKGDPRRRRSVVARELRKRLPILSR